MMSQIARHRSSGNGRGPATKRHRFNDRARRKWFNFEIENQNFDLFWLINHFKTNTIFLSVPDFTSARPSHARQITPRQPRTLQERSPTPGVRNHNLDNEVDDDSTSQASRHSQHDEEDQFQEDHQDDYGEEDDSMATTPPEGFENLTKEQQYEYINTILLQNQQLKNSKGLVTDQEKKDAKESPLKTLIRDCVTKMFRNFKFVTSEAQFTTYCQTLCAFMPTSDCQGANRDRWIQVHKQTIARLLNEKRSYYCTRIREVIFKKWLPSHGGEAPTECLITKVLNRTIDLGKDDEKDFMILWHDSLLPVCCEPHDWNKHKRWYSSISKATFTAEDGMERAWIPPNTEGFLAVVLMNNTNKWNAEYAKLQEDKYKVRISILLTTVHCFYS